jgi:uncharacterized protein (UPF0261 family)
MSTYLVMGTWNTKHEELDFLCREIVGRGHTPVRLDVSSTRFIESVDLSINDPAFGITASQRLCDLMGGRWKT